MVRHRGYAAEVGTEWVMGKVLERTGQGTVRHHRNQALVFTEFFLDYWCNYRNRTECVNEGRGEFHNFGEDFTSNKAIMLSPPPPPSLSFF